MQSQEGRGDMIKLATLNTFLRIQVYVSIRDILFLISLGK